MEIIINDNRPYKDFNTITFSNYKKNEVIKAMTTSLNNQDIEGALFWSTELLCSCRLKDIWDIYLEIIGKNVRCGNPKLPIYIARKFNNFKDIIMNGYSDNELDVRNSKEMRILISEVTSVICYSPKKPPLQMLKIDKKNDFSYQILGKQLKADTMDWCKKFLYDEDPNEIIMAINEFVFHLNKKNLLMCCYWVDWLIEFDALCHKQKKPVVVKKRDFVAVDDKFKSDPIWILWAVLLLEHRKNNEKYIIVKSLIELFSIKYNHSQKRKRRHLLYLAVELYTDDITMNLPILHHGDKIRAVVGQLGKFYHAIKKYEEHSNINSDKVNNLQKSIGKMNVLYNLR